MKKIFFTIFILMGLCYGIWQNEDFQRKYIYPLPEQAIIEKYAARYGVDPYMVAGVAMAESKFDPQVHSSRGAMGLMQLMPETALWIAREIDDENFQVKNLENPETNIKYGTWYLSELKEEFHNNPVLMLAAYNAGRGNVHEWMEEKKWGMDFANVEDIPYPETREYVKKVMLNTREYRRLYGKANE